MSLVDKNLSEIFNVESTEITPAIKTEIVSVETKANPEEDFSFARKNIKDLIKKGDVAIDNLLQVASASEHPRAYEVAAGLIKNLADLNKDLLEIQKRRKDLSPQEAASVKNVNVDKAVFVGSTAELVKLLKTNK